MGGHPRHKWRGILRGGIKEFRECLFQEFLFLDVDIFHDYFRHKIKWRVVWD